MVSCYNCREKPSNSDKWRFSLIGTIIVLIIFNPVTQYLSGYYMGNITRKYLNTSIPGYIISYILFTLLVRYSMEIDL
jgi:hypothetical protein